MEEMFCFQCQEAMNQTACTVQGMCGKSAACANLQDALIRASQYAALYDTASDEPVSYTHLDTGSLKKYMLIPLLSVAAAVGTSLRFLQGRTIDIKCIYILAVSFVLSGLLGTLCVKTGLLTYEEKENR